MKKPNFCRNFFTESDFVFKSDRFRHIDDRKKRKGAGFVKKVFLPDEFVKNIFHITPEKLKERNVKGIITDLDNTLVEWDRPSATPRLIEWFEEMKEHGIKVTIVSNNNERRVKLFSEPLGIPFIYKARKPMGRAFKRAVSSMDLKKKTVWSSAISCLLMFSAETETGIIRSSSCLSLPLMES